MRNTPIIAIIFVGALSSYGATVNMFSSYKEGEALGQSETGYFNEQQIKETTGHTTSSPSESSFYIFQEGMNFKAARLLHDPSNKAGGVLLETERTRGKIIIDPETDPLIQKSNEIVDDPLTSINSIEGETEAPSSSSKHCCYESGDKKPRKCTMRRAIVLKDIPPKIFKLHLNIKHFSRIPFFWRIPHEATFNCLTGEHGEYNIISFQGEKFDLALKERIKNIYLHPTGNLYLQGSILHAPKDAAPYGKIEKDTWATTYIWNARQVEIDIEYEPLPTEDDFIETIEDSCAALEELSDQGLCEYGKEVIIEGEDTRQFKERSVKRPWWFKERTYYCGVKSKNDCDQWRKRGCYQVHSECNKPTSKGCLEWKQTFECPPPTNHLHRSSLSGKDLPFGLDGSCANQAWKANEDMTEVLSKLSLLQEIKKESLMTKGQVFQGTSLDCSKHCLNFSDCCAVESGWGESLKLTSCSANEKLLAQKRGEGKCHLIGTYCAEKERITKICLRKKTTFCCYDSKLARVVQEGARTQLGLGWGSPKAPNCRALTVEEFSKVDFNKVNFSEVFRDVLAKIKLPDTGKILSHFQKNWEARLPSSTDLHKFPDNHSMGTKISERRSTISQTEKVGSYSLNESPPDRREKEETKPQVVF